MGRSAALAHDLRFADGADAAPVAGFQHVHHAGVPGGIERPPIGRSCGHVAPGLHHPALARGALLRCRRLAHDDAFAHGGVRIVEGWNRRVVRQAAGANEEDASRIAREMRAHRTTQGRHALDRGDGGRSGGIEKDRQHRRAVEAAEHQLQRLRHAVVHGHAARDGGVEFLRDQGTRQFQCFSAGHVHRARRCAVVAYRIGFGADADRRHHLVEKTVEMVRCEQDDQFRPERTRQARRFGESAAQVRIDLPRERIEVQERGVGQAQAGARGHHSRTMLLALMIAPCRSVSLLM